MARAGLGLAKRDLAALADVPAAMIARLERGEAVPAGMAEAVRRTLEAAGAEFTGGAAPGVRLHSEGSAPGGRTRKGDAQRDRSGPRRHVGPEDEERGQQAGDLPFNQRDD